MDTRLPYNLGKMRAHFDAYSLIGWLNHHLVKNGHVQCPFIKHRLTTGGLWQFIILSKLRCHVTSIPKACGTYSAACGLPSNGETFMNLNYPLIECLGQDPTLHIMESFRFEMGKHHHLDGSCAMYFHI